MRTRNEYREKEEKVDSGWRKVGKIPKICPFVHKNCIIYKKIEKSYVNDEWKHSSKGK